MIFNTVTSSRQRIKDYFAALPVSLYGVVLLLCAISYFLLTRALIFHHGKDSAIAIAIGRDFKGKISVVFYVIAILLAFINSWLACSIYILVAIFWLIPDRRIERTLFH